jgi:pyruvate ferredoxin oxidoreductase gamma subunit
VQKALAGFGGDIYTLDAKSVSVRCMGINLPNTPLLAAAVKVSGIMTAESFFGNMRDSFAHKFSSKPEVIEGNLRAIQSAWEEVQRI